MEESKDCCVEVDILFRRKRKTEKKKEENIRRRGISYFLEEKEKEDDIWRRSLQKLPRILRSSGFGLGLETFANFWRVSLSEIFISEKAPRLSISNIIWILSSHTDTICQLSQLYSNSEAAMLCNLTSIDFSNSRVSWKTKWTKQSQSSTSIIY